MTEYDPDAYLMQGGLPSLSFRGSPGIAYEGTVVAKELQQQRNFETGKPEFWDAEEKKPKMQLVITLQTDLRNPEIDGDDGQRGLYVKFNLQKALRDAVKASGAGGVEIGAFIRAEYYADDLANQRGNLNPPKLFRVQYTRPAGAEWGDQQPNSGGQYSSPPPVSLPPNSQPPSQPQAQSVAGLDPAVLAGLDDNAIAALKAAGSLPNDWTRPGV